MTRRDVVFDARRRLAGRIANVATWVHDYSEYVGLEHLPANRTLPRYGHGRPPHAALDAIVRGHEPAFRSAIETILHYRDDLTAIERTDSSFGEPRWRNAWIPPLDGACLYSFVRQQAPQRYVEVGSGNSTLFVGRAKRDGHLTTTITSIDPAPRADVDSICDQSVRAPLETIDLALFGQLGPGDITFIDNSHRALMNSDVTTFFLDVLPNLTPGVLVGIHDIFLPYDYFPEWGEFYFSEQYVLAAYLLGGTPWIKPFMASFFVCSNPELSAPLDGLWDAPCFSGLDTRGQSFWFTIGEH